MPRDHARLSPSAAERWFACPGAPNAEAGIPESTSLAASEGTRVTGTDTVNTVGCKGTSSES